MTVCYSFLLFRVLAPNIAKRPKHLEHIYAKYTHIHSHIILTCSSSSSSSTVFPCHVYAFISWMANKSPLEQSRNFSKENYCYAQRVASPPHSLALWVHTNTWARALRANERAQRCPTFKHFPRHIFYFIYFFSTSSSYFEANEFESEILMHESLTHNHTTTWMARALRKANSETEWQTIEMKERLR